MCFGTTKIHWEYRFSNQDSVWDVAKVLKHVSKVLLNYANTEIRNILASVVDGSVTQVGSDIGSHGFWKTQDN